MWLIDEIVIEPSTEDQLTFSVDFGIQGKARPRFSGPSGSVHMPGRYVLNKANLVKALRRVIFESGSHTIITADKLYSIEVIQYRVRPKAKAKKDISLMDTFMPLNGYAPGKPDVDNVIGTFMDAAENIIYAADSQVVQCNSSRIWSEEPGALLRITKFKAYGEEDEHYSYFQGRYG